MFACGYLLQDGSQCLHVSRRKALACVERGRLVDYANLCKKDQFAARSEAAIAVKNEIATRELVDEARAKVVKLEANAEAMNNRIKELEFTLECVRAERDAFIKTQPIDLVIEKTGDIVNA